MYETLKQIKVFEEKKKKRERQTEREKVKQGGQDMSGRGRIEGECGLLLN